MGDRRGCPSLLPAQLSCSSVPNPCSCSPGGPTAEVCAHRPSFQDPRGLSGRRLSAACQAVVLIPDPCWTLLFMRPEHKWVWLCRWPPRDWRPGPRSHVKVVALFLTSRVPGRRPPPERAWEMSKPENEQEDGPQPRAPPAGLCRARGGLPGTSASCSAPWTARGTWSVLPARTWSPQHTCVPVSGAEGPRPQWVSPTPAQHKGSHQLRSPPQSRGGPRVDGTSEMAVSSRKTPHPERRPGEARNHPLPQAQVARGRHRPGLGHGDPEASSSSGSSASHPGGALGSPSSLHCRQPPSWPLPFPSPWFISCPTRPLHPDQPADRSPGSSEPAAPDRGAAGSTPRVADHGALGGTPSSWGCQRQPGDRTPGALRTFLQFVITGDTQYKDEIVQTESAQLYQEGGRGQ